MGPDVVALTVSLRWIVLFPEVLQQDVNVDPVGVVDNEDGLGVSQDLIEAYKWFSVAATSGDEEAAKDLLRNAGDLDPLDSDSMKTHADGSGSFDIDPGDSIARYDWELDGTGVPDFDEATGETVSHVFPNPGSFNIGLRVTDNGVLIFGDLDDHA